MAVLGTATPADPLEDPVEDAPRRRLHDGRDDRCAFRLFTGPSAGRLGPPLVVPLGHWTCPFPSANFDRPPAEEVDSRSGTTAPRYWEKHTPAHASNGFSSAFPASAPVLQRAGLR